MIRPTHAVLLVALSALGAAPLRAAEAYVPQAAVAQAGEILSRLSTSPLLAAPVTLASAQSAAVSANPTGNTAQVFQVGSNNSGTISQTGGGNVATLFQQGQGNVALISQSGRSR